MDTKRIQELKSSLDAKETQELLTLWVSNDRETYCDEAFAAIEAILSSRNVEMPEQEHTAKKPDEDSPTKAAKQPAGKPPTKSEPQRRRRSSSIKTNIVACPKCGMPVRIEGLFSLRCKFCGSKFSKPYIEARSDAKLFMFIGIGLAFAGLAFSAAFTDKADPDAIEGLAALGRILALILGGGAFLKGLAGFVFPTLVYGQDWQKPCVEWGKNNERIRVSYLNEQTANRLVQERSGEFT